MTLRVVNVPSYRDAQILAIINASKSIVRTDKGPLVQAIQAAIRMYIAAGVSVYNLRNTTIPVKYITHIENGYRSKGTGWVAAKKVIREAAFGQCLYCLRADGDLTLDHYLPSSVFPEFSFFSINLVPVCNTCNKNKGWDYKKDGRQLIFNPYYSRVPNDAIFSVEVTTLDPLHVAFHVQSSDSQFIDLMSNHIEKLQLNKEMVNLFFGKVSTFYSPLNREDVFRSYIFETSFGDFFPELIRQELIRSEYLDTILSTYLSKLHLVMNSDGR